MNKAEKYNLICPICNNDFEIEVDDKGVKNKGIFNSLTPWETSNCGDRYHSINYVVRDHTYLSKGEIGICVGVFVELIKDDTFYKLFFENNETYVAKQVDNTKSREIDYINWKITECVYNGENILKEFSKQGIYNLIDMLEVF